MRRRGVAYVVILAAAAQLALAAPAVAGPGDNPCVLAISLLCRFVPIAPDLDHDIDLTAPVGQGSAVAPAPQAGVGDSVPSPPEFLPDVTGSE